MCLQRNGVLLLRQIEIFASVNSAWNMIISQYSVKLMGYSTALFMESFFRSIAPIAMHQPLDTPLLESLSAIRFYVQSVGKGMGCRRLEMTSVKEIINFISIPWFVIGSHQLNQYD